MFKKLLPLTIAASMLVPGSVMAKTDRVTTASYEQVSRRLLEYYSLSEAEAEKRLRQSSSIDQMIKENNRRKKLALQKQKVSFDLSSHERMTASYNAVRTLNYYRHDKDLLAGLMDTVNDLEFFNTLNGGLYKELDKTSTSAGSLVLASMLLNPLVSIKDIETRNKMLEELRTNFNLRSSLEKVIASYSSIQDEVLSFWASDTNLNVEIDRKLYFTDDNSNTVADLNWRYHYGPYVSVAQALTLQGVTAAGIALLAKGFSDLGAHSTGSMKRLVQAGQVAGMGAFLAADAFGSKWLYDQYKAEDEHRELIKLVRNRGMALGQFLKAAHEASSVIKGNAIVSTGLKNGNIFDSFENDADAYDDDFLAVKESLLNSSAYVGAKDQLGDNIGLVLVNDRKIRSTLASFATMFELIGEIDAYLSIVKLLNLDIVNGTKFSIPTPIIDETDPKLKIDDFWHPMIKREKVVTNSIALENGFRGIILTGSNTGGKSTALKGMLISSLLGQSWGIFPGTAMEFTPFTFIGSFMNVTDNIAEKASLFQSEVDRAKKLIHIGKDVARSEGYGLVVMDELFTGTNPKQGEKGTNRVANKLFLNVKLITLFATHYESMTKIPSEEFGDQVRNYKIDVDLHPTKKNRYISNYQLVPGVSSVDYADFLYDRDL